MNYQKIYNKIIDRARNRTLEGYVEKHHVIPKSFGGPNKKENLVKLTPREHYVCHLLLAKIYGGKMISALWFMIHLRGVKITSKMYDWLRKKYARRVSENSKGHKYNLGRKHTRETNQKVSEALKGRKLSEDIKLKISECSRGCKRSEETKQKIKKANIGKKATPEARKKMSEAMLRSYVLRSKYV
jgi:NUMOD3 motif